MVARNNGDNDDIIGPAELGAKFVLALRSVNDPQVLMQAVADRSAATLRGEFTALLEAINTRIEAMDKATSLWHEDLVRVPTQVDRAVNGLKDLMGAELLGSINALKGAVEVQLQETRGQAQALVDVSEERFRGVQTQFTLLKQATEQLDLANKTAIAAALQAQKESAGETQKSSQAAIAKSEASTSESIKALTAAFTTEIRGITERINDLKGRLDRGEGFGTGGHQGQDRVIGWFVAAIMALVAVGIGAYSFHSAPPVVIQEQPPIVQPK